MRILKFLMAGLPAILGSPEHADAAAWLQPENMIEVHYEHVRSTDAAALQGIENEFIRNTDQLYVEYGLTKNSTVTAKHLSGNSGSGVGHERGTFDLQEITLRTALSADKLRMLPLGTRPLWRLFSPDAPKRYGVASFELGLGHGSGGGAYLIAQLNGAEKIETTHQHPLSLFLEISLNYQRYENTNQGLKAVSRLELGHRGYFLAYERLDGRFWGHSKFNEHLWFAEAGIPLAQNLVITAKRGHERSLPGLPRKQATVFGLRLKLKKLP